MRRRLWISVLALAAILALPGIARAQADPPDEKPKNWFDPIDFEKKKGTWHYVASVGDRVVGRLMIRYWINPDTGETEYQEEENRVCALGRTTVKRQYELTSTPGMMNKELMQELVTQIGPYKYNSTMELGMAGTDLVAKGRINAPGRTFDANRSIALPDIQSDVMKGKVHPPILTVGILRLLIRRATDMPEVDRPLLYMEIPEARRGEEAMEITLKLSGVEDVPFKDKAKPTSCRVFDLKGSGENRGKFWVTAKGGNEIVQFVEKLNPRVEITYTYAGENSSEAKKAVDEKAAKWGANPDSPQALTLHWLKAVLNGDQATLDKLVDKAKCDEYPVAPDRKALLDPAELRKFMCETPSEQIFRWVYEERPKGEGRVDLLVPAVTGVLMLAVEKQGDAWKVIGVDPPPPLPK